MHVSEQAKCTEGDGDMAAPELRMVPCGCSLPVGCSVGVVVLGFYPKWFFPCKLKLFSIDKVHF